MAHTFSSAHPPSSSFRFESTPPKRRKTSVGQRKKRKKTTSGETLAARSLICPDFPNDRLTGRLHTDRNTPTPHRPARNTHKRSVYIQMKLPIGVFRPVSCSSLPMRGANFLHLLPSFEVGPSMGNRLSESFKPERNRSLPTNNKKNEEEETKFQRDFWREKTLPTTARGWSSWTARNQSEDVHFLLEPLTKSHRSTRTNQHSTDRVMISIAAARNPIVDRFASSTRQYLRFQPTHQPTPHTHPHVPHPPVSFVRFIFLGCVCNNKNCLTLTDGQEVNTCFPTPARLSG